MERAYPRPTGALEEHAAMACEQENAQPSPLTRRMRLARLGLTPAECERPNMGNVPYPDAAKESE